MLQQTLLPSPVSPVNKKMEFFLISFNKSLYCYRLVNEQGLIFASYDCRKCVECEKCLYTVCTCQDANVYVWLEVCEGSQGMDRVSGGCVLYRKFRVLSQVFFFTVWQLADIKPGWKPTTWALALGAATQALTGTCKGRRKENLQIKRGNICSGESSKFHWIFTALFWG